MTAATVKRVERLEAAADLGNPLEGFSAAELGWLIHTLSDTPETLIEEGARPGAEMSEPPPEKVDTLLAAIDAGWPSRRRTGT